MKKIIMILMVLVISASIVIAPNPEPWHRDCTDNGFDFAVAKFECNEYTADEETPGYEDVVTIDNWSGEEDECHGVEWSSTMDLAGVVSKEATDYIIHDGGYSGIFQMGSHSISHVTFCADDEPIIPEFSTIGAGIALIAVAGFIVYKRKK